MNENETKIAEIIKELKEALSKTVIQIDNLQLGDGDAGYVQSARVKMDVERLLESAAVRTKVDDFASEYETSDYYSSSLDC